MAADEALIMSPKDHLEVAEDLLGDASELEAGTDGETAIYCAQAATARALMAIAELMIARLESDA